ncbi:hypothetical protein [Microcoleus sp.]
MSALAVTGESKWNIIKGLSCHRDLNAAINLASVSRDRVRMANPEFTPVE